MRSAVQQCVRLRRELNLTRTQEQWLEKDVEEAEFEAGIRTDPYDYLLFYRHRRDTVHEEEEEEEGEDDRPVFSFKQVDQIYLHPHLGRGEANSLLRIRYMVAHWLSEARTGNFQCKKLRIYRASASYLYVWQVREKMAEERIRLPQECLGKILGGDDSLLLVDVDKHGEQRLVLSKTHFLEQGIAQRLAAIHEHRDATVRVEDVDPHAAATVDATQAGALRHALQKGVSLIYGYPGTGKTHVIRSVVRSLKSMMDGTDFREKVRMVAPTGMAAKNMTMRVNSILKATTIHRLFTPRFYKCLKMCRVLIVDEVSMVPYEVFHGLLHRLPSLDTLVLVGDDNQLPCIGQGQILRDLMRTPLPQTRLSKMYRVGDKAEATRQLINIVKKHQKPEGVPGVLDIFMVNTLLKHVSGKSSEVKRSLDLIRWQWRELKRKHGGADAVSCICNIKNTGFIVSNMLQVEENAKAPMFFDVGDRVIHYRTTEDGGNELSPYSGKILAVNPCPEDTDGDPFFSHVYSVEDSHHAVHNHVRRYLLRPAAYLPGDLVQLTRNNAEAYVNGDFGTYQHSVDVYMCDICKHTFVHEDPGGCKCRNFSGDWSSLVYHQVALRDMEDGREVVVPPEHVDLAYVRTTHKFQGRQNKAILFITGSSFGKLPMLYTGCSRWEEQLVLVTTDHILTSMMKDDFPRQTRLDEFVGQYL